ncbi:DENN domain-containing protein 1B isoform X2 [Latimeria chalumnae]|uniref:DENN domain-containing protein 1B isoform X2 n=1 Tax=Latimeria chalumnae TaxID=7897 RepID=UPI00313B02D2
MGSRIKENPVRTFDWFFEVSCPKSLDDDSKVLGQFPEGSTDQELLQTLPKFCFPFDVERVRESPAVQNFTFVLTDLESNQRFGFCRLSAGSKTCLCILSYLPWFEVFYKLLNNIADYLAKEQDNEVQELLTALYNHPVPQADSPINLEFLKITTRKSLKHQHREVLKDDCNLSQSLSYFIAPETGSLPTIPESRNLTEFVVAVDVNNMLHLYASMLYERRILITSSKLSTLTACVHASSAMLYPMYWQHIYIPVLPPHLLDYCCAPMPYLIGVHSSLGEKVKSRALEDVVFLNIDTNTLETPFNDLEKLPAEVVSLLKLKLKKQSAATGDGVARAFLTAQAVLFGGYRDALACIAGEPITFSEEAFLSHKCSTMKQFLQNAVHLQLFKQFIDGRLEKLNTGVGFSDVFEDEITLNGLSTGSTKSYQLWVENLKKGGGALIHSMKSKANPAVKNMYKYAKGQAKMGLKEMKNRLKYKLVCVQDLSSAKRLERGGSLRYDMLGVPGPQRRTQSDNLQSRLPITQHFGQSRPKRPMKRYSNLEGAPYSGIQRTPCEGDEETPRPPDDLGDPPDDIEGSFLEKESMDLLGEIFDTLSTQMSRDKGLLYGTRSLDFVGLEDSDYIRRVKSINPSDESLTFPNRNSELYRSDSWCVEEEANSSEYTPSPSEELDLTEGFETAMKLLIPEYSSTIEKALQAHHDSSKMASLDVRSMGPSGSGLLDRGTMEDIGTGSKLEVSSSALMNEMSQSSEIPYWMERAPCLTFEEKDHPEHEPESRYDEAKEATEAKNDLQEEKMVDMLKLFQTDQDQQGSRSPDSCNVSIEQKEALGVGNAVEEDGKTNAQQDNEMQDLKGATIVTGEAPVVEDKKCQEDAFATDGKEHVSVAERTPRIQSAVALFQAKAENKNDLIKRKSPPPSVASRPFGGTGWRGSIYRGAEVKAEDLSSKKAQDTNVSAAVNGSLAEPSADEEAPAQGQSSQSEKSAADTDLDVIPVPKVSELKKRFEA